PRTSIVLPRNPTSPSFAPIVLKAVQSRGKNVSWQCARRRLAVSLLALGKRGLRLRARFFLVALLPLARRHAVDDLARLILFQADAFLGGCFAVPVSEAIPTEARKIHHVDILHISAAAQMRDEPAERRGFKFCSGLFIHDGFS